jgi:hypothetical protein
LINTDDENPENQVNTETDDRFDENEENDETRQANDGI